MKIDKPSIIQQENKTIFRVRVESSEGTEALWYSLEMKFGDFVTDFCDAPLVALLIPAVANGEDIHVAGVISERLWYNVTGSYQHLLQRVIPDVIHCPGFSYHHDTFQQAKNSNLKKYKSVWL